MRYISHWCFPIVSLTEIWSHKSWTWFDANGLMSSSNRPNNWFDASVRWFCCVKCRVRSLYCNRSIEKYAYVCVSLTHTLNWIGNSLFGTLMLNSSNHCFDIRVSSCSFNVLYRYACICLFWLFLTHFGVFVVVEDLSGQCWRMKTMIQWHWHSHLQLWW